MSPWKVIPLLVLLSSPLAKAGEFLRIVSDNQGNSLLSSVTQYIHPSGVKVTLIAAVHVGEKSYYQSIASQINSADALVYEGIFRKYATLDLSDHWFTSLGLFSQQSMLRYLSGNTVRGDLTSEQFDLIRKPAGVSSPPDTRDTFANQLIQSLSIAERDRLNAACAIPARNQAAICALQSRLARGDHQIAMLYGAAHCEDMENRLMRDLGFKRTGQSWLSVFSF